MEGIVQCEISTPVFIPLNQTKWRQNAPWIKYRLFYNTRHVYMSHVNYRTYQRRIFTMHTYKLILFKFGEP